MLLSRNVGVSVSQSVRLRSRHIRAHAGVLSGGLVPAVLLGVLLSLIFPFGSAAQAATNRKRASSLPVAGAIADPGEGRRVFLDQCAGCHGEHGDGRSPLGPSMRPPAFDLTGFELSELLIWRAMQQGVPGSEMPAWNTLSNEELGAVVAYTAALGCPGKLPENARWATPGVLQEAGRRVYAMHCTPCHGESGDGNGPEADRHSPRPADFTNLRPSYAAARRVIYNGVAGTSMPAWPLLTEAEVQAVTHYIRSLYRWPERTAALPATTRPGAVRR